MLWKHKVQASVVYVYLKQENVFTREINRRLDAVEELCSPCGSCLSSLKGLLTQLPDVERGLCTIYHKKVSFTFAFPKCFFNRRSEKWFFNRVTIK